MTCVVLHPQAIAFLASNDDYSVAEPGFGLEDVEKRRLRERADAALEDTIDVAYVDDVDADGVTCRLYRPNLGAPVLLHLHGGGFVFGDIDTSDSFSRYLAATTGWAVLSVDYRRAPEDPYPAAVDDCQRAARWLFDHGEELTLAVERVAVVGDSAGANLAAALAIRHPDWFALQVLVYPCLDPEATADDSEQVPGGLSRAEMTWYWDAYLPDPADRREPDACPVRLDDPRDLPPTVLITAEHDPLRDEGEAYVARLAAADVPTVATRYLGMVHGFWRHPGDFDASRAAVGQVAAALAELVLSD